MLALLNLVPVAAKWLLFLDFERVATSLRHFSPCAWPDRSSLALPGLHLVSIGKNGYHFSTCADHPCAEAGCPWGVKAHGLRAATFPKHDFSNPLRRGASRAVVAVALFLGLPLLHLTLPLPRTSKATQAIQ